MSDDHKPAKQPDETKPSDSAPHNLGLAPKPSATATDSKPAAGAPYDKKADPEQQPT